MASEFELDVELRTDKGKGASRRLRRNADLVPAILYGAGKEPQPLSIPHKDLHKALENEAFYSHIITIKADGKAQEAILKDLQRHPAKDRIMHADFMRVQMDQAITVEVPLHFVNEESCVGVKQEGGTVFHNMSLLEISCLPGDLPEYIEVDVAELHAGESVHMSQVSLPSGLTIPSLALGEDHDQVVVSVHTPRGGGADDDAEESDSGEAAEGGEGEE